MIFARKGIAGILDKTEKIVVSFLFFFRLLVKENFKNYIIGLNRIPLKKNAVILANGPSLKKSLEIIRQKLKSYKDSDFWAINDFSLSEAYEFLKPKFYVISDSKYFMKTIYEVRSLEALKQIDEKTTWDLNLYVPFKWRKKILSFYKFKNPYIHLIPFHSIRFWGADFFRMLVYKWGLGNGEFGTVIINAIYIALVLKYKKLYLYGVDHTFFDGLCVNKNNQLCYIYRHFDDAEPELKPMISHHDGVTQFFTMQDFLVEKLDVWTGHVTMKKFADYMGATIINCTECSMIDVYSRGTFEE